MSPELGIVQRRYGDVFRAALREALAGLSPEDRSLLRLHYLESLNIGNIAFCIFLKEYFITGAQQFGRIKMKIKSCGIAGI